MTRDEGSELLALRSHFATLRRGQHVKLAPYVFTEHGAFMAANVVNSPVAVLASIQVVRAFVQPREMPATHKDLARKLEDHTLQRELPGYAEYTQLVRYPLLPGIW